MNDKKKAQEKAKKPPRGLGKGLDALIPSTTQMQTGLQSLPLHQIHPNKEQPRKEFDTEALEELAASIKEVGVIQPILVKKEGREYQIIAGERRFRAAGLAGLTHIPVLIRDVDEIEMIQIALLENIQRENLNPIELANSFQQLIDEFGFTHERLSKELGKSRSSISNTLRMLQLSEYVQSLVIEGQISEGHAKVLAALELATQENMATQIIENQLSVRETEALLKERVVSNKEKTADTFEEDRQFDSFLELEKDMEQQLQTKVRVIKKKGVTHGKIEITFANATELDRLFLLLRREK